MLPTWIVCRGKGCRSTFSPDYSAAMTRAGLCFGCYERAYGEGSAQRQRPAGLETAPELRPRVWVARHVTGGGFRVFSSEAGFFAFMKGLIDSFASGPADRAFEVQCVTVDEDVPA